MSLTLSFACWLSLTVCPRSIELLHVSHCLVCLLAVSHYLSRPMKLLHVSYCLPWLLPAPNCLSNPMQLLHVAHHLL